MSNWTQEETAELRRLRVLGYSFSMIGEKIKRTEDACVSKADRIGMRVHSPAKRPKAPVRDNGLADILGPPPAGVKPIPLSELRTSACRWPYGDPKSASFGFCGDACEEGKSYCADHAEKAVTKRVLPKIRKRVRPHSLLVAGVDEWAA